MARSTPLGPGARSLDVGPRALGTSRRSLSTTRSRMLVAVALAGAAALLAGCGAAGDPAAPPQPSAGATGADPVPIDDERLQTAGLFDEVSAEGYAVRWAEPGESIAVFLGGSGGGGGCIPQPHAAESDGDGAVTVAFDPPDPAIVCTADFTLHGWELGLPSAVVAAQTLPVRLVNLQGGDETIEVELGPDDVLGAGGEEPSADPQPSEIPDAGETPEPAPIPDAQLLADPGILQGRSQLTVQWIEPGRSLAVLLGGSGTEACVPQPIGATSTGPGTIEVAFEPVVADACTDDLVIYGWQLTLPEAVSATLPLAVTVTGVSDASPSGEAGPAVEVALEPDDVLELP